MVVIFQPGGDLPGGDFPLCSKCDSTLVLDDDGWVCPVCQMNDTPKICSHHNFDASVHVNRLEDIMAFTADIKITCKDCGTPFTFIGVKSGLNLKEPRISPFGIELRCPIEPLTPLVDDDLNKRMTEE